MNLSSRAPGSGRRSVLSDVIGGGTGAHAEGPGLDGVDTYMANVGLMPVEVAETNYSVRILRTELIEGSQGRGRHDGGRGLRREYLVLERPRGRDVLRGADERALPTVGRGGRWRRGCRRASPCSVPTGGRGTCRRRPPSRLCRERAPHRDEWGGGFGPSALSARGRGRRTSTPICSFTAVPSTRSTPLVPGRTPSRFATASSSASAATTTFASSSARPRSRSRSRGGCSLPGFQDAHVHASAGGLERIRCDLSPVAHARRVSRSRPPVRRRPSRRAVDPRRRVGDRRLPRRGRRAPSDPRCGRRRSAGVPVEPGSPRRVGEHEGARARRGDRADAGPERRPNRARRARRAGRHASGRARWILVDRIVPRPTLEEQRRGILEAQRYLLSLGVTGWQEAIVGDYAVIPDCFDAYVSRSSRRRADGQGRRRPVVRARARERSRSTASSSAGLVRATGASARRP